MRIPHYTLFLYSPETVGLHTERRYFCAATHDEAKSILAGFKEFYPGWEGWVGQHFEYDFYQIIFKNQRPTRVKRNGKKVAGRTFLQAINKLRERYVRIRVEVNMRSITCFRHPSKFQQSTSECLELTSFYTSL